MDYHIVEARYVAGHIVWLRFCDGTSGEIALALALSGPVFEPKISALANFRLDGFSVERLMHFLNAPDRDVEILIRRKPRSRKGAEFL